MGHLLQRNIVRFITLFGLQILIFNNVPIFGYSIPYVYVLFFIMLPFEIHKTFLLILGFVLGTIIDFSTNSPGVHAGATLLIAFVRPYILQKMSPRQGYDINSQPMLAYYGFRWFFQYALIMVSIHHFVLFFYLSFSFEESFFLVFRAIINIFFTMLLIIISQYLVYKK
ncbi:MAG TPA: hypothetical protein PLS12_07815 [Bacteroidales bacterium]|jgi:hypothetical protein|nr:hypothetical protein [Bacteroidales bacterium]